MLAACGMETGHVPLLSRQAQREISDNWLRLQVHETLDPRAALLLAGFGVKKVRFFFPQAGDTVLKLTATAVETRG